jgi:hypothetical protein
MIRRKSNLLLLLRRIRPIKKAAPFEERGLVPKWRIQASSDPQERENDARNANIQPQRNIAYK